MKTITMDYEEYKKELEDEGRVGEARILWELQDRLTHVLEGRRKWEGVYRYVAGTDCAFDEVSKIHNEVIDLVKKLVDKEGKE